MIGSPPEEAEHIRGKTLTPESPKPLHYPSPSNIPILEMQMDPVLNEAALSIGTPASFQYPQQTQTPSAHSSASFYAEPQSAQNLQNAVASGSAGAGPAGFAQMSAYNGAMGAQTQSAPSNHNFSAQQQAASSLCDATSAPAQDARSAYPFAYDTNAYATQQPQPQPVSGEQQQTPATATALDVQALLDQLSTPANNGVSSQYAAPQMPPQPTQAQGAPSASTLPAAPNLPPRPPPQAKPVTHPNYNPNDDIRSYHPHSGHRGSTQLQPLNIRGDEGSKRSNLSPTTPSYGPRRSVEGGRSTSPSDGDEDQRWPPEINRLYEDFLDQERRFVTEGQWDQFPVGSRLFIGNLPTEKVTKRDIFHRFYRHGQLAQISIKQAYGFVQFLHAESCAKALQAEQGQQVRGKKMHLEISKPQRNTKKAESDRNAPRRRSRSPDYGRGGTGPAARGDQYGRNQSAISPRDRDNRRFRDDYRPNRSPSPRDNRGYRGRDRSRDRYDQRRRSRSRSPRRYRSPSPRPSDGLPLPPRPPHMVPEVQVIAQESLPKDFVQWVEDALHEAGLRVNVLRLSPRLEKDLVVQRQIVEGVTAIVELDTAALASGQITLQVFDRRNGLDKVQFNKYPPIDIATAIALVKQAKQNNQQPVPPPLPTPFGQAYGAPPPTAPYAPLASPGGPSATNLSNLISTLRPEQLSQLLAAMPPNSATQAPQPQPAGLTPELARLLSAISTPTPAPTYNTPAPPLPPQSYQNPYQNPTYPQQYSAQLPAPQSVQPSQQPSQPATPGQPDMNEIMAQLAKYQRS
ncbi:hypothetical protein K458DRAFT_387546 [Lentithecium fluviatile CBS 122367]|uniref:RRM domain-containing protein n=1 Tax=Lentithecium fluviatile CBS 122367 TaxID=1168545 RepID=A0A6G1J4Y7_9PLEO|nr:hypothetical protein K458DRAFT_387546 [Lentithecium fluviatile CBS 122367]